MRWALVIAVVASAKTASGQPAGQAPGPGPSPSPSPSPSPTPSPGPSPSPSPAPTPATVADPATVTATATATDPVTVTEPVTATDPVTVTEPVTAPAPAPVAPPSPAAPPIALSAWAQVDIIPYAQDSADELNPASRAPENLERVLIRRARVRATGERHGLRGMIELDGNTVSGATARLNAATIDWSWRPASIAATDPALVTITAGLFKIPFGADVPTADRDRIFLEPGWAARALFPGNYDGGAMLAGGWRFARWQVAITNGAPVGDAQWTGRDPTSAPDLVGRAGIDLELGGVTARGGLSGLVGTGLHAGTPATKDQLTWVDANEDGMVQTTELGVIPGRPALPSETFARSALGADLAITWCADPLGHGQAFGEVAIATDLDRAVVVADPVAADRSLRELGWQIGAWQELGPWARIGVRYDAYRPDRDAREVQGANVVGVDPRFTTLAALASLRWREHRATLEYDHERNPLGRGLDGQPTSRGADRLTARLQVTW